MPAFYCVAKGTFHQSSPRFSAFSRGSQCVANAAIAIAHAVYSRPCNWTYDELDTILTEGDSLYVDLRRCQSVPNVYLLVVELPQTFVVGKWTASLVQHEALSGWFSQSSSSELPWLRLEVALEQSFRDTKTVIFVMEMSAIAIIRSKCDVGPSEFFYVFDSHSRDEKGAVCLNGRSVLICVGTTVSELATYLRRLANSLKLPCNSRFEATPITVAVKRETVLPDSDMESAASDLANPSAVINDDRNRKRKHDSTDPTFRPITSFFTKRHAQTDSLQVPETSASTQSEVYAKHEQVKSDAHILAYEDDKDSHDTLSQESSRHTADQRPSCWTSEQWLYFNETYPWLYMQNGFLGCVRCQEIKTKGFAPHVKLSSEWSDGMISSQNPDKSFQQKQLRKKLAEHNKSHAHKRAEEMLADRRKDSLKQSVAKLYSQDVETTSRVFRTVYFVAKQNRPFLDYPELVSLQETNGTNMGRVLHSKTTAADIALHLASGMRKKVVDHIRDHKTKIAVMVDESTTASNRSALIIYVRGQFGNTSSDIATTVFFDLVELTGNTASAIKGDLIGCFENHNLPKSLLADVLIGFCSDGASVMTGRVSGLATLLRREFPNLKFTWHCLAHRLELAVGDTVKEVGGINHFKIFLDALYSTYSMSPKNTRQLFTCANELGLQLRKIGKMLDTRWVASSFRTVAAVWNDFRALNQHFLEASTDGTRDSKERSKYVGLHGKLTSNSFVNDLAIMLDALRELKDLSECLQHTDITIVRANQLVHRQVRIFRSMKETAGPNVSEAEDAVAKGKFHGVQLSTIVQKATAINRKQFFESLSVNLEKRLSPDEDICLVNNFKVLDPDNWPDMNLYGEKEVRELCSVFNLAEKDVLLGYRDFKENRGERIPSNLKPLFICLGTVPESSGGSTNRRQLNDTVSVMSPSRSFFDLLEGNVEKLQSPGDKVYLLTNFQFLDPKNWPNMNLYGENEVRELCTTFNLNSKDVLVSFRDFKENHGRLIPTQLKPLFLCLRTLPASSADCERGFSEMNLVISPTRSSLSIKTTAALMFMKLNGPPLHIFDPLPYVKTWLAQGRRSADSTECMTTLNKEYECERLLFWQLFA